MEYLWMFIYAAAGFSVLVFFHELGHLLLAKWSGIGVEEFSIGFGPSIYEFTWKKILWKVSWVPFGGYCKMAGQDDFGKSESINAPDSFYERPPWARLVTVLAGPAFSVLFGVILVIGITAFQTEYIIPNADIYVESKYQDIISLKTGDEILTIDGDEATTWNEVIYLLNKGIHKKSQHLEVKRDGNIIPIDYQFEKEARIKGIRGFSLPRLVAVGFVQKELTVDSDKKIKKQSPASKSGIEKGDVILAVDNHLLHSELELIHLLNQNKKQLRHQFVLLKANLTGHIKAINGIITSSHKELEPIIKNIKANSQVNLTIETFAGSKKVFNKMVPVKVVTVETLVTQNHGSQEKSQKIGIAPISQPLPAILIKSYQKNNTILEAIPKGLAKSWDSMVFAVTQFGLLSQLKSETVQKNLAGPLGIFRQVGKIGAEAGFDKYISIIAIISILLGVFNLLPIPAIDGFHIVLTLYEIISRQRVSMKVVQGFQVIGVFIIISLLVLFTINDVINLFTG